MSNHGDDCYFFYYSTCTKGDSCPFRHCEAAMGNETVCSLWQEGRCFRTVCKFRHMEITKNRKEIPCYWENQAAGCQKPHCAFFHEKPRYVDGMFVPPDKTQGKNMEQPHDEPAPPPAAPAATIPQLRGVIKTEAQEPVPSPTHPPVVINPADDDEDEDEEGEVGPSPRKLTRSDNSLNFGVSTLEEIRLRKALKASMKRAGYPIQNADASTNREKENIQSIFRPVLYEAGDETGRPSGSVTERLGKKMPNTDVTSREAVPLKRSLAERLGRVADEEEPLLLPQKALKPIKERLGLSAGSGATQPAESNTESKKAPEQIRIKTLEEIRQEKAAKTCSPSRDGPQVEAPQINSSKSIKGVKRTITVKDQAVSHVKTFSEILHAKKKRQEEEKAKYAAEEAPGKSQGECDTAGPDSEALNLGDVRVKTLDEIRREKAARIQAQQVLEAENSMSCDAEENCAKKPRLLRIKKSTSQSTITAETTVDVTERPLKPHAAPETSVANGNSVKVKTFEEIMREKHLRKQEMEERAKSSAEAEPCQKQAAERTLKRKVPLSLTPPRASSPSSTTLAPGTILSTQHVPVRKLIPLKSKAASPLNSSTAPCTRGAAVTAGLVKQNSSPDSHSKSPSGLRESPEKNMNSGRTPLPTQQARAGPQGPTAQAPSDDKTLSNNQKEYTTDTKVRPKLNVKPSVMKPAVHMKPGQKRRGTNRSAVAAVKPLNSASTVLEERLQEMTDRQVFPSPSAETQLSSSVPCSPSTLLDSGSSSSPLREELQTVPVFKQSQETKMSLSVAAREACTVPQSPILKTPTQPKSRRMSVAASRSTSSAAASTSAVDDFEELISEFTSDHLVHEDVDPDIGEDDLLQELSEMIDS